MKDLIIHSQELSPITEQKILLTKQNEKKKLIFLFEKKAPEKISLTIELAGKNSSIEIIGLYKGTKKMHSHLLLNIIHSGIGTKSNVYFKAALEGTSHITFTGTVLIEKNAKNADAKMVAKALLLSENAQAFIKPDLEILNHEVKASHGSSIGRINTQDLFYLQSRGLSLVEAKNICVAGFFNDITHYTHA